MTVKTNPTADLWTVAVTMAEMLKSTVNILPMSNIYFKTNTEKSEN